MASLVDAGYLRRRTRGWFWTRRDRAAALADIRSSGGSPVRVVEESTGRLVGTVDNAAADTSVHRGAVYVHFGETYLVERYDIAEGVALVNKANPDYSTSARVHHGYQPARAGALGVVGGRRDRRSARSRCRRRQSAT